MNTIVINGNLTADPKTGKSKTGKMYAYFTVAVNRRGKDAGADFIPVVCWEQTAKFVDDYFVKGKPIIVRGKLISRIQEDNGHHRTVLEVLADQVDFVGPKSEAATNDDFFDALPV